MNFLNPGFLWALPLVALPVIIHLLAKRKSRRIDFPSLKFLKLLEQDALRRFNVKQLLLLILRTLMILLIILIFARPTVSGNADFSFFSSGSDLLVIAVDNSASSRQALLEISPSWLNSMAVNLRERGFRVIFADLSRQILTDRPETIEPGYGSLEPRQIRHLLTDSLDISRYREKHLVWIGDGQDADSVFLGLSDWKHYLLRQPVVHDWGVHSIRLPEMGIRSGESYELEIGVSHAADDQEAQRLDVIINENRQNQTTVDAASDYYRLTAQVMESGFQLGQITLGRDTYSYNDLRYFSIFAGKPTLLQIVRTQQTVDIWRILKTVVEHTGADYDVRLYAYDELDNLALSGGGTVIIEDAALLQTYTWKRLITFLHQGGQVILFGNGGPQLMQLMQYQKKLAVQTGSFPFGLKLTAAGRDALADVPLEAVLRADRLKVFKRYYGSGLEPDATWIRYLDDQPFLGAVHTGRGRLVWFNTDFNAAATNLAGLGVFPPLLLQLSRAPEQSDPFSGLNRVIGDTLIFLPDYHLGDDQPLSIQRPDGNLDYQSPDSNYMIAYTQTDIPGFYQLTRGRKVLQTIAVNVAEHEAGAHARPYDYTAFGVFTTDDAGDLEREILERQSGVVLWPVFLSILLLLWVAETYLSRIKSDWRSS